jgi:ABC-type multidrug transport system fused ATPase/permease subunit
LIIAHRLSTIRSADLIIVMEEGKIVESGSHEVLMKKKSGIYQNMVKLQTEHLG